MKTDLAYIVSHGFAARMVMQTDLLGKLVEQGIRVALIAPDDKDANLRSYCSARRIELYQFNPRSTFWNTNYAQARMYFLENINNNPALLEKYIYAMKYRNASFKAKMKTRAFKLVHDLKEIFPFIREFFKKRESKMLSSPEADELIKKINPSLLISTYPVNYSEAMLVKAAQNRLIKTVMHLLSWDNISCKGHFPVLADEYIAWGPIMRDELKEYYNVDDSKIQVTGVPHFDLHRDSRRNPDFKKFLQQSGLHPEKPYIFFGMSSPRFAPKEIDIVEWLSAEVCNNSFGEKIQLIIRPHPQNVSGSMADQSWIGRLEALRNERVVVDFPDLVKSKMPWSMQLHDMERLSQLLAGCSVSINSGSTLSIDALTCGVPVILTSFDGDFELEYWKSARRLIDYTHLKKLVDLGGVSVSHCFKDLKEAIHKYIQNGNADLDKREWTVRQQTGDENETATNKVCKALFNILEEVGLDVKSFNLN